MNISSNTKLYAVIGDPIEHSLSPLMQNIAFKNSGINGVYLAFRVKSQSLENAIYGMKSLEVSGFNVTIPHKISVIQYLNKIDSLAAEIGSVNTVVNRDGELIGYNTDGEGAITALREENIRIKGVKVVLLGAGGAAKALAFSFAPLAESIVIFNRTESKAKALAISIKKTCLNVKGKKMNKTALFKELADTDILVNATSVGMYPKIDETLVKNEYLHKGMVVFDIIYNPLMTRLLKEAKTAGARAIGGAKMLVYQGALAFKLWTGLNAPIKEMYTAIERVLRSKCDDWFR